MTISEKTHYLSLSSFLLLILFSTSVVLYGCRTKTRVGGFVDSPDKRYRAYLTIWGAAGQPFNAKGTKSIRIRIAGLNESEILLLERSHKVEALSLDWDVIWEDQKNVAISFFDYGPTVNGKDGNTSAITRRTVLHLTYKYDSMTGKFIDREVSP